MFFWLRMGFVNVRLCGIRLMKLRNCYCPVIRVPNCQLVFCRYENRCGQHWFGWGVRLDLFRTIRMNRGYVFLPKEARWRLLIFKWSRARDRAVFESLFHLNCQRSYRYRTLELDVFRRERG